MRRYVLLLVVASLAALAAGAFARRPHEARIAAPAAAQGGVVAVSLAVTSRGVTASAPAVPLGSSVRLAVTNRSARAVRLSLAGYGDRLPALAVPARGSAHAAFAADRPGDDFVWLVDGEPAGRFAVSGSHLAEGHR